MKTYEETDRWEESVLEKVREKMKWVCEKNREKIPYTTGTDGSYDDRSDASKNWNRDDGLNWWTNGFWSGLLWLLYQDTRKERYLETAREAEYKLEKCLMDFYGMHHDLGFMFQLSAAADWDLTGNERSRRMALHAASLLAGRFNPEGNFIRAWNDGEQDTRGWAIIDCMMNLSLLYWAEKETKDPRFGQIARRHADTAMKAFIRPDGSANHIVEFDPQTGEVVRTYGGQGYKEGSSWTRGQGWAVYGFTLSYLHTGKQEYLDTAKRAAHYCIAAMPESGIIPVDFRQPKEPAYEDSCGACVIAGGLLELAGQLPKEERGMYVRAAEKILRTIAEKRADFGRNCDAIVQNCTAAYGSPQTHITMVYADYFFVEALYKLEAQRTGKASHLMW